MKLFAFSRKKTESKVLLANFKAGLESKITEEAQIKIDEKLK